MPPRPGAPHSDSGGLAGRVRLVSIGATVAHEYSLDKSIVSVGSHPSNDIVLEDLTVSRRHATIATKFGRFRLSDLDSTNGSFLNGVRVRGPIYLRRGDEVRFGSVRFAFVAALNTPTASPSRTRLRATSILSIVALMFAAGFVAVRYRNELAQALRSIESRIATRNTTSSPTSADNNSATTAAVNPRQPVSDAATPGWLKRINYYRKLVALPPVVEDSQLSRGDHAHALYVVKNFRDAIEHGSLGAELHTEDPAKPGFTPDGLEAAKSSDIDEWYMPGTAGEASDPADPDQWAAERAPGSPEWTIDGWMAIPFHRFPILNPHLQRAGFGIYCEAGACTAGLNLLNGTSAKSPADSIASSPIQFPPAGSTVYLNSFGNEWPDPRTSCPGYAPPSGLAITIQLGAFMESHLGDYSLARIDSLDAKTDSARAKNVSLEGCGFDSTSYANPDPYVQQLGRDILKNYAAVVVIPRAPLASGATYDVSITANDKPYRWRFTIAAPAPRLAPPPPYEDSLP